MDEIRRMTLNDFNAFCASLPNSTFVIQWGGSHVWKIGGKVFAIGVCKQGEAPAVTFKCSPMSFDLLKNEPGLRPAPYLAPRGMIWLQRTSAASMDDGVLQDYVQESYRLVAMKLPAAVRKTLTLKQPGL